MQALLSGHITSRSVHVLSKISQLSSSSPLGQSRIPSHLADAMTQVLSLHWKLVPHDVVQFCSSIAPGQSSNWSHSKSFFKQVWLLSAEQKNSSAEHRSLKTSSVELARVSFKKSIMAVVPLWDMFAPSVAITPPSSRKEKFAEFSRVPLAVMFQESMVPLITSAPSLASVLLFIKVRFRPIANVRLLTFSSGSISSNEEFPTGERARVAFRVPTVALWVSTVIGEPSVMFNDAVVLPSGYTVVSSKVSFPAVGESFMSTTTVILISDTVEFCRVDIVALKSNPELVPLRCSSSISRKLDGISVVTICVLLFSLVEFAGADVAAVRSVGGAMVVIFSLEYTKTGDAVPTSTVSLLVLGVIVVSFDVLVRLGSAVVVVEGTVAAKLPRDVCGFSVADGQNVTAGIVVIRKSSNVVPAIGDVTSVAVVRFSPVSFRKFSPFGFTNKGVKVVASRGRLDVTVV